MPPSRPPLLRTFEEKVDPRNAALVVVDVQNDFIAQGGFADRVGWECQLNRAAAERLAGFLEQARATDLPIIWIQAIYDEIYLGAPMIERNLRRGLDLPRCQSGSWGADFYLVRPRPGEPVIRKHRYSAFSETELHTVLRHLGVQSLLLTGVYTEGCVESTARHGYFLDYYIVMVDDCCGSTSEKYHRDALEGCERDFGVVTTSDEIIGAWQRLGAVARAAAPASS
jgi:ureidoacrylate peracid hydrolase